MYIRKLVISVLTNASGDFTGYSPVVSGEVRQVRYTPDGTVPLDTGADLDITGEDSGIVIVNKDNIGTAAFDVAPRIATHDTALAASLFAATGEPVEDRIAVAGERLKLVIAQGGNAKAGRFDIWIG
jgi:hypothetical protein